MQKPNWSLGRAVHAFGELMDAPNLDCYAKIVEQATIYFHDLWENTEWIRKNAENGEERIKKLKQIEESFWELLYETKYSITQLKGQAIILKKYCDLSLKELKINSDENIDEKSQEKLMNYISVIGEWMDIKILDELSEKWKLFNQDCEAEKSKWNILKDTSSIWWNIIKKISLCIGGVAVLASIVITIVVVSVYGTPAAGAAVAATSTEVASLAATWIVDGAIAGGIGILSLAFAYGIAKNVAPERIIYQSNEVIKRLQIMITIGKEAKLLVGNLNIQKSANAPSLNNLLKSNKIDKNVFIVGLEQIKRNLEIFVQQADKVNEITDDAQRSLIPQKVTLEKSTYCIIS